MNPKKRYRVSQFAALTGVSIRTLHHYDSIGLLRPSARSPAGYRLYSSRDLALLQQILTLRSVGFDLRQIGELLAGADHGLIAALRIQQRVLRERIGELERIEGGLSKLLADRFASGRWNWELARDASPAAPSSLPTKGDPMSDYYPTAEIPQQVGELAATLPPGELDRTRRRWQELLAEVHANLDLPPESAAARELAARWETLHEEIRQLFQGNENLWHSLGRAHLDGRYDNIPDAGHAEDYAFVRRIQKAAAS
jgi:DNA-binding transcriptional MerR regulator